MADYAISNVPRRVVYAASGTGPYAFTFEILNQTDIAVYKASTLLTLTTDYSVTINANGTGSVTLVTSAGTSNITIVGAKNIQRTTDFTTGGDLFANTLNDELDNQTIYIQQVAETAERGLKAPVTDPTDIAMTLPPKTTRAGTVLAFNATTGNPETGPSIASVTTVAAQSANINTVATNIASVNTVAGNSSNINTVAGVSGNVTTVAGSISNVNTVADDLNEAVSEINTVAVNIADVNSVGTNISNVNTVAGINANVTSVAGNASNINTVAGINSAVSNVSSISSAVTSVNSNSTNINTVAGQISPTNNVSTVAGISANVSTVAGNSSNVTTVAGISGNVTTVAGISANVTTVANNSANVTTVAGISSNVTTVATNIANVNQVAADTAVINSASANATTATTKAAEALASANSASESAAAASAVVLSNEPVRPTVRPSLLLDFANTKALDPRITFSRPTTATYYDNHTTVVAEQNLQPYSQDFSNTATWGTGGGTTTITTGQSSPDGNTTATLITAAATNNFHIVGSSAANYGGNGTFTVSAFLKAGTNNFASLSCSNSGGSAYAAITVNFSGTPAITQTGSSGFTYQSSTITQSGATGWYRVSLTLTSNANFFVHISLNNTATPTYGTYGLQTWTATGTETVYLWGAQLEQRSSVTAYQVTTTVAITNYIPVLLTQQSNEARFDHNPTTRESLGLLIEQQSTNLNLYSSAPSNWTSSGMTVTNNQNIAPDGTQTAAFCQGTNSGVAQFQFQYDYGVAGTAQAFTLYVKAGTSTTFIIYETISAYRVTYDLVAGTATVVSGTVTAYITPVGNGWFRLGWAMATKPGQYSYPRFGIGTTYNGVASSLNFYVWGAQYEVLAFPTSYIPTVASQVTRSADSASMTGANFSSWFSANQGTLYAEASVTALGTGTGGSDIAGITNSAGSGLEIYRSTGLSTTQGYIGSGTSSATTITANTFYKYAINYTTTTGSFVVSGGSVASITPASYASTLGVATTLGIMKNSGGGNPTTGYIKKLAYYPIAVTSAQLQSLTG